jgi:hypothetical protein
MAKQKKPEFEWFRRGWDDYSPVICENGEKVINIYTYGGRPLIVCRLDVAYYPYEGQTVWSNGSRISDGGPGWRYRLSSYCGGGFGMIHLVGGDGSILANSPKYATRNEAIRTALYEFVEGCDKQLLIPSDSSRPIWGRSQGYYISRPGREQLAYYLCMPEWEPMWQLLDEVTRHDDWLAEVRAPKKSEFIEQLNLF